MAPNDLLNTWTIVLDVFRVYWVYKTLLRTISIILQSMSSCGAFLIMFMIDASFAASPWAKRGFHAPPKDLY